MSEDYMSDSLKTAANYKTDLEGMKQVWAMVAPKKQMIIYFSTEMRIMIFA
jgi:hypothetical protein